MVFNQYIIPSKLVVRITRRVSLMEQELKPVLCTRVQSRCHRVNLPHSRLTPRKIYYIVNLPLWGYGWGNVCYILIFPPGEYLLYSQVSGRKAYYIANIPRGNVHYIVNIPGVRVSRPLVFCVVIFRSLFIRFLLVIVFFVPIRLPNFNYPFDVFKPF